MEVPGPRGGRTWLDFDGNLHRDGDLPAVILADGSKLWYRHGEQHRDNDRPAEEQTTGQKVGYQNGKLHRTGDLPAFESPDGIKYWYQNDFFHRMGGPAEVYPRGHCAWHCMGKLHRAGDAAVYSTEDKKYLRYWIYGRPVEEAMWFVRGRWRTKKNAAAIKIWNWWISNSRDPEGSYFQRRLRRDLEKCLSCSLAE